MTRRIIFSILAGILLLAIIAVGFYFVYQAGVGRGAALNLAEGGEFPEGAMPFFHGVGFRHMPFMAPFGGFLGCLGPLFLFFLVILVLGTVRRLACGRPWMHGPWAHGPWQDGDVPPMFSEWHRRVHEKESQPPAAE